MLKNKLSRIGALTGAALIFGMLSSHSAGAAVIVTDVSSPVSIPGISDFQTSGADMDGMAVTVNFFGGGSETVAWADTGPVGAGAALGTGWSISLTGDSFSNAWQVDFGNLAVTSFVMNGAPGLTVFDIDNAANPGTPGSALGLEFASSIDTLTDPVVTYSNVIQVGAAPPFGDLFEVMTVDLSGLEIGGISGQFTFVQDTDNDIRRDVPLPEPGTLGILGGALIAIGLIRRVRTA